MGASGAAGCPRVRLEAREAGGCGVCAVVVLVSEGRPAGKIGGRWLCAGGPRLLG